RYPFSLTPTPPPPRSPLFPYTTLFRSALPAAVALFCFAGPARAADAAAHPIAGTWIGDSFPDRVLTVDGQEPPLTAEGAALYQRSEEHTSELQSRENLVCRLLLEKKKP